MEHAKAAPRGRLLGVNAIIKTKQKQRQKKLNILHKSKFLP